MLTSYSQLAAWQAQQRLDNNAAHWLLLLTQEDPSKAPPQSPHILVHAVSSSPVLLSNVTQGPGNAVARPVVQLCREALAFAPLVVGTRTPCAHATARLPRHSRVWKDMRAGDGGGPVAVLGSRPRRILGLLASAVPAWMPVVIACALADTRHVYVVYWQ